MKKQPNLLFVFADQWRRQATGFAKQDPVITPNMDSFAKESACFTNAVSTFPLCSPHRASLLTGKHPFSTGVFTNCKPNCSACLKESEVCISDVLKENDYQTAYIGKWHLDEPELNYSKNPASGAKNWDAYTPPGARRHGFDFWHSYGAWDHHLTPHYWENSQEKICIDQWSPEHETDVAIDYINKHCKNEKPFAMFISWNPPHTPYESVPQKYFDLYKDKDIALRENVNLGNLQYHTYEKIGYNEEELITATKQYFAAVSGLDDQFGRLIKTLKEQSLFDDTIVVLSADHGDMMGSHGLMAKHVWYEESIGIPLVIGGNSISPKVSDTVFGSPDFMPTLLSLMELPIPKSVEGVDCSEVINSDDEILDKVCYICACPGRDRFLNDFSEASKNPMDYGWRGVRTVDYSYIVDVGYDPTPVLKRMLYDLKNDPLQLNPLMIKTVEENSIAKELEAKLSNWLILQKDGFIEHIK